VAEEVSGDAGGGALGALIAAAVTQVVASTQDSAHIISMDANQMLFTGSLSEYQAHSKGSGGPALLYGPYRPQAEPTTAQ
jgi:hypothetical protein